MVAEPTNKLTTKRYTGKYFFKKRIKKSILPTSLSGYAGILDTATALQAAGWRLAIVSNKPDNATKALWKTYFPTFDLALGEGPDLPRKPAPDMVLRALEQLETPLERAIYIGDSEVDVATARAAGIPCISACWGYRNEEELLAAGARHLCRTPRDIPAALEELRHGQ